MLGLTPNFGSKSKLAKHKRFRYKPYYYNPIKEDLKQRKAEIKERINTSKGFNKTTSTEPYKPIISNRGWRLIGLGCTILFFIYTFIKALYGDYLFGDKTEFISMGGMIIFALLFVRMSKK